jgi:asparagine synthase (glutamine-hydrolysing)
MCGFVGFMGDFELNRMHEAVQSIRHRGPDDIGHFSEEKNSIALGFARLAIQDLTQAGHQPMISQDSKNVLVFNGEIYNVNSLRKGLQDLGYIFKGTSDTEVLLNMYIQYDLEMLPMLNGMFSFAIWDASKKEIILGQDAYGIKPLYYFQSKSGIVFGSEIKAIMSVTGKFNTLDHEALLKYVTFLWCPGNSTPAQNLFKVNPGELVILSQNSVKAKQSWLEKSPIRNQTNKFSAKEYICQVRDGLRTAVSRQLISDVPVGAFLSGGLDSSAIVAFAKEKNPQLECFTIEQIGGEDRGQVSDLYYADKVSKYLNVPLNIVQVNSDQLIRNLEDMIWHLDEPLADPAALNVYHISKLAKEAGIKVLLSGAGGDDLFTGYRRHAALNLNSYIKFLLPQTILNTLSKFPSYLNQDNAFTRKLSKILHGINLNDNAQIIDLFKWTSREDLKNLLNPEILACSDFTSIEQPMHEYLSTINATNLVEKALALDKRFFLSDHNFTYTDKMSMAASVEVRVPFLDNDLVQIANNIPIHLKQTLFHGKWVLKKAMEGILPNEIIYRPKTGFGAPLRRWIGEDLKPVIADYLSHQNIKSRGIFDPIKVKNLISDNDNGKIDGSYTIFSILCIEIWCRKFLKSGLE